MAPKKAKVEEVKEVVPTPEETKEVKVQELYMPEVPKDYKTRLTKAQQELLRNTIAIGASDDELKLFLYVCQRTGLDPFTKQIHLVPIWNSQAGQEVRVPIIGIDGLRSVAERSGSYVGSDDATFVGERDVEITETQTVTENGKKIKKDVKKSIKVPQKAVMTVRKIVQGQIGTFTASAEWEEYCPKRVNTNWANKPKIMLSKCAEAKALRKAFPLVLSGLYINEEVEMQKRDAIDVTPPSVYQRAVKIIEGISDPEELDKTLEKIKNSPKYSDEEKKKIEDIITKQKVEIIKKIEEETNKA